jgi:two-component system response regulator FixJ
MDDGGVPIVVRAMACGALTVLEKPCNADELSKAIRSALDRGCKAHAECLHREEMRHRLDQLHPREWDAMRLIVEGQPNKTIAHHLGVSRRTVDRIRAEVYKKLGVESAVELARIAAAKSPRA